MRYIAATILFLFILLMAEPFIGEPMQESPAVIPALLLLAFVLMWK